MFSLTKVIVAAGFAATSAVAFSGDLTYYSPGLGACGTTAGEGDAVVALSAVEYGNDPNPNNSPVCNKDINISYQGKTVTATVVDKCPECASGSIDVSPSVFTQLADLSVGRIQVTWDWA